MSFGYETGPSPEDPQGDVFAPPGHAELSGEELHSTRPTGLKSAVKHVLTGRRVEPHWKHCLLALPVALLPAAALVSIASGVAHLFLGDISEYTAPEPTFGFFGIVGTVIFAPVVETLMMAITLPIIHAFTRRIMVTAVISAVLWGLLHALFAPMWFIGPAWGFYVLSASYLAWRDISFSKAFTVACIPHVLNNGLMLLTVFLFAS